ncbi:MAG: Holliday junction branch migration DNA helicase RuvB [Patescibacteria group bacterium]|nr:Holliday junction branch migration DNA helicase RuvB [Patescibacteria group bacterium]MDD5567129.1 Holliday junction branch migration DNA helicase RuvB [Patescibacteria group bacterium]
MPPERVVSAKEKQEDAKLDQTLRPRNLKDYVGQNKIKENLHIFMSAAKQRREPIEHVLLHGSPGLGKTTLAHIIAREMGVNIRVTSGPAIERAGDLGSILTNLEDHDIIFIDEIHRLNRTVEETLYPAMEEYVIDVILGKGLGARTMRLDLPKFTLIGATTQISKLSSPLRDRFGNTFRLEYYLDEDIEKIINRSAKILKIPIEGDATKAIAKRSRKTPRIANRLLKRVRDYAQMKNHGRITVESAEKALDLLGIDHYGLDNTDRLILETIIDKFSGGPVGLNTVAASTSEEMDTIVEVYEPFLLQIGFLARTPRGRVVTKHAYDHLGRKAPKNLQDKLI